MILCNCLYVNMFYTFMYACKYTCIQKGLRKRVGGKEKKLSLSVLYSSMISELVQKCIWLMTMNFIKNSK